MSFDTELALDRLEAELAAELPGHMRAFARAYGDGTPTPAAPESMRRPRSLDVAFRALDEEALALRALRLVRLLAPLAIDDDVGRGHAAGSMTSPGWPAWTALASARSAASTRRFHREHVSLLHWLHGTGSTTPAIADWPANLEGWHDPAPPISLAFVERAWRDLADRHGVRGTCRIVQAGARPRAFLVEPGREVIVVIGELATPAARFAALHELGHAVAGLLSSVPLPRMLDEAAAAYVARLLEREGDLDLPWFTPVAAPARARRLQIATALDACERGMPAKLAKPPWALWNDPGAQATYVVAERFADRWWAELGAAPGPGGFARALAAARDQVDRTALADRALSRPMLPAG